MLILRRRNELIRLLNGRRLSAKSVLAVEDEYTDEPQYPEIKDLAFQAKKQRAEETWHSRILKTPTVEEKLIKINMPRYYGYKVFKLNDEKLPYNCLPAIQHYTRTIFESGFQEGVFMSKEEAGDAHLDGLVQTTKSEIQDSLEFSNDFLSHKILEDSQLDPVQQERNFAQTVIEQLNRVVINALGATYPHLQEVLTDLSPRHEAFWQVGGIDAPKNVIKSKEGREWQKAMAREPVDRLMQYNANPYLALRHSKYLTPFKSIEESQNVELAKQIPRYKYDPRTLGFNSTHQHGTNIPGYWPSKNNDIGYLSYQSRAHLQIRPESYGAADFKEVLHAQAILSSYAWLLGQANYNGFNTYNDITYPMNTQTIITNGRDWSFYEYQLNTLLVHSGHVDNNPLVNFCRGTDEMQLFQEFDKNGKCVGFNEEVLRHLLKFYTNIPTIERSAAEAQPYLDAKCKTVADYADAEKRTFLEKTFKHICSNRPRHLALPEIYLWEKIYKIDNNTRPLEAKRRYFELDINPWKRTLDQHAKEYIPRAIRLNGPKDKKNKRKNTYYPPDV